MRKVDFVKMHGAGNDFVVLDGRAEDLPDLSEFCSAYADRNFGVGFDQLLVLRKSEKADHRMEIWNAEGSEVEMCGNGIRAFFKYLRDRGLSDSLTIQVETLGGIVSPHWIGNDLIAVDMGPPVLVPKEIPTTLGIGNEPVVNFEIQINSGSIAVTCVSMGNPHAVVFVDNVESAPVEIQGPEIEHHPAFPNRVNVEFVEQISDNLLRQRTWERGVGETLACGSGACATGVAAQLLGISGQRIAVELRGGTLDIRWGSPDSSVIMTGPAAEVFKGELLWPPNPEMPAKAEIREE